MRWESVGRREELGRREVLVYVADAVGPGAAADLTTLCDSDFEGVWGKGQTRACRVRLQLCRGQCSKF